MATQSYTSDNYGMVAAVDFGTTFSGYAFSFKNKPKDIRMNKNWGQAQGCDSYKTPTCVLVNGANEFEAFGYEAENKYVLLLTGEYSGAILDLIVWQLILNQQLTFVV